MTITKKEYDQLANKFKDLKKVIKFRPNPLVTFEVDFSYCSIQFDEGELEFNDGPQIEILVEGTHQFVLKLADWINDEDWYDILSDNKGFDKLEKDLLLNAKKLFTSVEEDVVEAILQDYTYSDYQEEVRKGASTKEDEVKKALEILKKEGFKVTKPT